MSGAALRLARDDDLEACGAIWRDGIADYERRLGRTAVEPDLGPVLRLLAHLRATDPERFWVAVANDGESEQPIGFGAAVVRGHLWYLSMLFVTPAKQGRGIGQALLERTLPDGRLSALPALRSAEGTESASGASVTEGPMVFATATDAAQPIANAIYARLGIVPRIPVWNLAGRLERAGLLPPLPAGIAAVEIGGPGAGDPQRAPRLDGAAGASLEAIDRSVFGFERLVDHERFAVDGRRGYLYRDDDGVPVGYGYATPVGRVGPVATRSPELLVPVVGHLLTAVPARGASVIYVPGSAGSLFRALLEVGFRLDGFPALLCWTAPFAQHDRYCPGALALP